MAVAPNIPTVEESGGMKGFEFVSWYGLWAPKNLPADVSAKLSVGHRQGAWRGPRSRSA